MDLFNVELTAGVISPFDGVGGRYLRILSGADDIEFTVLYSRGSMSSKILAGIGIDLSHPETGEPFKGIRFKSGATQVIRVLVSWFPSTDSRLAGDVDINGLLSVVNSGGSLRDSSVVAVDAATATKLLDADIDRLKAALNFSGDCFIGKDGTVTNVNGYPVTGGTDWVDENTGELWVYSVGAISVRILQDLK